VRRLLALGVAIALVAIAVVIRNGIDSGSSGTAGGKLHLVCAPELASTCNRLGSDIDVTVEDPGTTLDALEKAGTNAGLDGWLTPGPWPEIVREARLRAGKEALLSVGPSLGRSRVGLAVWPDRLAVLLGQCPNRLITWRCLGDVVTKGQWSAVGGQAAWGRIKVGFPDPTNDATGLAALGTATVGFFGRPDLSSSDLDDPGFRAWLRSLATANADHPSLDDVLTRGPAEAAAVATFDAVGQPVIGSSARSPKPTLTYPAPVASAGVVLGRRDTGRGRQLESVVTERIRGLLKDTGWQLAGPPPSAPPFGLPPADLLDALRSAWKDAAG
jgi:hypothetical protein